jgi:sugar lactone lactonase YvrE
MNLRKTLALCVVALSPLACAHGPSAGGQTATDAGKGQAAAVAGDPKSEALKQAVVADDSWKVAGDGYKSATGAAANAKGEVFFNDPPDHKTYKIGSDGKVVPFLAESENNSGQAFGPDGKLYAITILGRLLAFSPDASSELIGFDAAAGRAITVRNDGSMYLTGTNGIVWRWNTTRRRREEDKEFGSGTGIAVSPDQSTLYVADGASHWVYSYQIQPDGSLTNKQRFHQLQAPAAADAADVAAGMCVDADGRLYVATAVGVEVFDPAGSVSFVIPVPSGRVTSLCFGGDNGATLFATAGDKVFARQLKVKGAQAFDAPAAPKGSHS